MSQTKNPTPAPRPKRTAKEQALVDAYQNRQQLIPPFQLQQQAHQRIALSPDTDDGDLWTAKLANVLKIDDPALAGHLLSQLTNCFPPEDLERAVQLALAVLAAIKPQNALEAILSIQMVSVHNAGMTLLTRSLTASSSDESTILARRANDLLKTFTLQMQTLHRTRHGGQHRMRIEHVHINEGGQAVIGSIENKDRQGEADAGK